MDAARTPQRSPGYFTGVYKNAMSNGLYTQASANNVPEGYSPAMENVLPNSRGNLVPRLGTQQAALTSNPVQSLFAFRSRFGLPLLIVKQGTRVDVRYVTEVDTNELEELVSLESFDSLFSLEANASKATFQVINDRDVRVVMCTGTNVPVQLRFTERQYVFTSNTTSISILNPDDFKGAIATRVRLLQNGELLEYTNDYTYDPVTGVITLDGPRLGTFNIIYTGWQWYTEAKAFYGINLSRTVPRFNTGPADLSVEIPVELLQGIRSLPTDKNRIPIRVYKNGLRSGELGYNANPTLENQYTFSGGSYRTAANNQFVLPGITHITLGLLNASATDISELTFIRGIDVSEFNGEIPVTANDIRVFVNEDESIYTSVSQAAGYGTNFHTHTYQQWQLLQDTASNNDTFDLVSFGATANVGVPSSAIVRVIRDSRQLDSLGPQFIGPNIVANVDVLPFDRLANASWWPIYGFSEHANFLQGSFPKYSVVHENRLVFAGFALRPNRIAMSAVGDSVYPGDFYSDFTIIEQEGRDTDAVAIDINTDDVDGITALNSTAGVLFVFTLNNLYIVSGGESGITPLNRRVTKIASVGAVNAQCVVNVNDSVVFLSRTGVYRVAQSFDAAGGWRVSQISEAVNDRMLNELNQEYAWMAYSQDDDLLFCAVVEDKPNNADALYVLKRNFNSWTKFTNFDGFYQTFAGTVADTGKRSYLVHAMPNNRLVTYPYRLPIDESSVLTLPVRNNPAAGGVASQMPFKVTPDVGIEDIRASGTITFNKRSARYVEVLSATPPTYLVPKAVTEPNPVVAYIDNVLFTQFTHDPVTGNLTGYTPEANDVVGFVYRCFVTTPVMLASSNTPNSFLPANKTLHSASFVFHTDSEYRHLGVLIKAIDYNPTQVSLANRLPANDTRSLDWQPESLNYSAAYLSDTPQALYPLWKAVIHPGGIDNPFHQFIVYSDSTTLWELVSFQPEVSGSGTKMQASY